MTKEIKIGLSVLFSLLVVFGVVLVYKLRAPVDEPTSTTESEADAGGEQEKHVLASGPGGPTVLAANDKPERAPRNDSHSADKAPPRSLDRYPPYGATTKASSADNGDQQRPVYLPKAPPETGKAGDEHAPNDDRDAPKERYPREHLTGESPSTDDPSHVATAGNQQPTEVAADGRDADALGANEDPFARRSTQGLDAEPPTPRTRLLPADNVQLTPNPHASSADGHATGTRMARDAKAGKLNTTAGAGDPPPAPIEGDSGERGGASGADPFEKRSTGTRAADIYGENSKRNDDKYGLTANGATGNPHVADQPPGVGMPYRDRFADLPDGRMQPRGTTSVPDANASERAFHQGETYTVEPNDSYWTISEKVYGTGGYFKAIQKHNQPKTGRTAGLNVGQSLSVPAVEVLAQKYPELCPKPRGRPTDRGQMMTAAAGARDRLTSGGRVYVVEKGDTLFDIARYELGKPSRWKEIYDLNSDQLGQDYDHLSPGMKLMLPDNGQSETITSKPQNPLQR